jgi:hypothetical protein
MNINKFVQLLQQTLLGYLLIILSWKTHIEFIKSELSSVCYAMRSVKPNVSINTL